MRLLVDEKLAKKTAQHWRTIQMIKLCNDTSTAILFCGKIYISLDGTIVGSDFTGKRLFFYINVYGTVRKLPRLNVPESLQRSIV